MRKTWNCTSVDLSPAMISDEEHNQILEEWAEIVYRHLCQLSENKLKVPEILPPCAGERTGTDG